MICVESNFSEIDEAVSDLIGREDRDSSMTAEANYLLIYFAIQPLSIKRAGLYFINGFKKTAVTLKLNGGKSCKLIN